MSPTTKPIPDAIRPVYDRARSRVTKGNPPPWSRTYLRSNVVSSLRFGERVLTGGEEVDRELARLQTLVENDRGLHRRMILSQTDPDVRRAAEELLKESIAALEAYIASRVEKPKV